MIHHLSCEFVLKRMPNGGTAVLLRSVLISIGLYLVVIAFKSRITPGATWSFDSAVFRSLLADTIPWFGAIFAGVYVALYSRFASQWNYVASLYNQIMQTAVQHPRAASLTNPRCGSGRLPSLKMQRIYISPQNQCLLQ
jgi:hypothetical protein